MCCNAMKLLIQLVFIKRLNHLFSRYAEVESVEVGRVELDLARGDVDGALAALADILEGLVVREDTVVEDEPTGLPPCTHVFEK